MSSNQPQNIEGFLKNIIGKQGTLFLSKNVYDALIERIKAKAPEMSSDTPRLHNLLASSLGGICIEVGEFMQENYMAFVPARPAFIDMVVMQRPIATSPPEIGAIPMQFPTLSPDVVRATSKVKNDPPQEV